MNRFFTIRFVLNAFLIAWLGTASAYAQAPIRDLQPTVILISIDGFRFDYIEKYRPPTLSKFASEGVRAKWMTPSFPTKTFPNHYTLVTGLFPENHGIIENNIWDFGTTFTLGKVDEIEKSRWWLGEPIWVTAEKQGQRSAAFFWPGSEAEISGVRPTFWKRYDGRVPNDARVEQVLNWLELPRSKRPTFYTLYYSDVDDAGHAFSPDSPETGAAVKKVDASIEKLLEGLQARKIGREVNIIIVSDHGMVAVPPENSVVMDDFMDFSLTQRILWNGEILQIFPKTGAEPDLLAGLQAAKHTTCWPKNAIPSRFHYRSSPRIAPIVCSSAEGWYMTSKERLTERKKRADFGRLRGAHGYDNSLKSMQAIFLARGTAFKENFTAEPISNVNVYELMCHILGLKPAKNDGDFNAVRNLLK